MIYLMEYILNNTNELKPVKEIINKHKVKTLKIVLNGIWTRVLDFLVPMC